MLFFCKNASMISGFSINYECIRYEYTLRVFVTIIISKKRKDFKKRLIIFKNN